MPEYFAIEAAEAIKELKGSEAGLDQHEAERRLQEHGYNELPKERKFTALKLAADQFKDPLILLLVFAGLLSLFLHEMAEATAIFVIILINAMLGFVQEYRAEKAIEALEKIAAPTAKVMRGGSEHKIPARELVPGDILLLEAGDIVPADSRLLEVSSLQIDEASLTGESVASKKVTDKLSPDIQVADQENMSFMGTVVTYGKGKSIVTATGAHTEFGKIASALKTTGSSPTPLQMKFSQLAKQIGIICLVLVALVFVVGLTKGMAWPVLVLTCLTLTVSTIPNSLPLVVTVGLSMGTKELARKNMLVKKLPAAEGLGSATIICSDKTGTITKNQMTVTDIYYSHKVIKVSGSGYEPRGDMLIEGRPADPAKMELLFRIGYLCNNAELTSENGKHEIIGDPTEGSLKVLGKKANLCDDELKSRLSFVQELPFDSDRKRMSVIYRNQALNCTEAYVKGGPDLLLSLCDRIFEHGTVREMKQEDRQRIMKMNDAFAGRALRVLALAFRDIHEHGEYSVDSVERNLIFVGLAGMIDPPREEVKEAIEKCKEAGIRVMIITGDHAVTTKAVANKIGLFEEGDLVLTGDEIRNMSDEELEKKIESVRIIARAMPIQKLRVVDALQKKGHIVAMTGDGVNDAPALKKANIGIAMGINGTDVAKEVSETTLVDDNFATIVNAIETGRNIYDKLIKSAKFFLSCNFGEITAVLVAVMLGFPLPLLPLQILLMNILTDNFPALGLGFEKSEEGIMKRPPRNPRENPLTRNIFAMIVVFGLAMGIGSLIMFHLYLGGNPDNLSKAQTVAFTTLVMFQMFAVMSSRTLFPSLKHLNPFSNMWLFGAICLSIMIQMAVLYIPGLQAVFGTVPLTLLDWIWIMGISSMGFVMMEASKLFMHRWGPGAQAS